MGRKTTINFEDIMMSELLKLENHYSAIMKDKKISEKAVEGDMAAYLSSLAIKDTAILENELSEIYDGVDKEMLRQLYTIIQEAYMQGYRIGKYVKLKNIKN